MLRTSAHPHPLVESLADALRLIIRLRRRDVPDFSLQQYQDLASSLRSVRAERAAGMCKAPTTFRRTDAFATYTILRRTLALDLGTLTRLGCPQDRGRRFAYAV